MRLLRGCRDAEGVELVHLAQLARQLRRRDAVARRAGPWHAASCRTRTPRSCARAAPDALSTDGVLRPSYTMCSYTSSRQHVDVPPADDRRELVEIAVPSPPCRPDCCGVLMMISRVRGVMVARDAIPVVCETPAASAECARTFRPRAARPGRMSRSTGRTRSPRRPAPPSPAWRSRSPRSRPA